MTEPAPSSASPPTILVAFGTRPEAIKLAPVIASLKRKTEFRTVVVSTGQHTDLLTPFVALFDLQVDHELQVMQAGQTLNQLFARIMTAMEPILRQDQPQAVLVQGDTTTAVATALAAFQCGYEVGHVEAGLRTENPRSPFPEEMNRRLVTRVARWHFTATSNQTRALLREGIPTRNIIRTGNTVVDAMKLILKRKQRSPRLQELLDATAGTKRIILTTHRRESFETVLDGNLHVLKKFVEAHADTTLVFPVHPNPSVKAKAASILAEVPRVFLTDPLDYPDFLGLLSSCWLIASDSGGVQEEAPSLGKPLLILRSNTERPEVLGTGLAQLCPTPEHLARALKHAYDADTCTQPVANPFGDGRAADRIVSELFRSLIHTPHTDSELVV